MGRRGNKLTFHAVHLNQGILRCFFNGNVPNNQQYAWFIGDADNSGRDKACFRFATDNIEAGLTVVDLAKIF